MMRGQLKEYSITIKNKVAYSNESEDKLLRFKAEHDRLLIELEKRHVDILSKDKALHNYLGIEKQLEDLVRQNEEQRHTIEDLHKQLYKYQNDCGFY